jgi:hypothetical protein
VRKPARLQGQGWQDGVQHCTRPQGYTASRRLHDCNHAQLNTDKGDKQTVNLRSVNFTSNSLRIINFEIKGTSSLKYIKLILESPAYCLSASKPVFGSCPFHVSVGTSTTPLSWFPSANAGIVHRLSHDHFLLRTILIVIYYSSYHSTLCSLSYWQRR